jgi:hypothetical protein
VKLTFEIDFTGDHVEHGVPEVVVNQFRNIASAVAPFCRSMTITADGHVIDSSGDLVHVEDMTADGITVTVSAPVDVVDDPESFDIFAEGRHPNCAVTHRGKCRGSKAAIAGYPAMVDAYLVALSAHVRQLVRDCDSIEWAGNDHA